MQQSRVTRREVAAARQAELMPDPPDGAQLAGPNR